MCKFWLGRPYLTKLGALTQLHVWLQVQYMFSVSSMGSSDVLSTCDCDHWSLSTKRNRSELVIFL